MAVVNGTKVWETGKITSSRFPGRTVAIYNNVNPAVNFQAGTIGEFPQEFFPNEPESEDCAPIEE